MPGLSFLNKKSWHTTNVKNVERVWLAEKKAEEEQKRLAELQKQLQEERQILELRQLQAAHGQVTKTIDNSLDWMYEGPVSSNQKQQSSEEYLLGKIYNGAADHSKVEAIPDAKAPAKWLNKVASKNDSFSRAHEDPFVMIKQEENRRREKVVNNPIKMDKIKQKIASELQEKEDKKRLKKLAKREKKEQKKESKRRRKEGRRDEAEKDGSSSSSSESEGSDREDRRARGDEKRGDVKREESPLRSAHNTNGARDNSAGESRKRSRSRSPSPRDARDRNTATEPHRDSRADSRTDSTRDTTRDTGRDSSRYERGNRDSRDRNHGRRDSRDRDSRNTTNANRDRQSSRDRGDRTDRQERDQRATDRYREDRPRDSRDHRDNREQRDNRDSRDNADRRDDRNRDDRGRDRDCRGDRYDRNPNRDNRDRRSNSRTRNTNTSYSRPSERSAAPRHEDSRKRARSPSPAAAPPAADRTRTTRHTMQHSDEEGSGHDSDAGPRKPKQMYGLLPNKNRIQTDSSSSSSAGNGSLGPNPALLQKKLDAEKAAEAERKNRARGDVRGLSEEERQRRILAMQEDAQKNDAVRTTRHDPTRTVAETPAAEENTGNAAFLESMRKTVYTTNDIDMQSRIDQNKYNRQSSAEIDSADGFLRK